MCVVQECIVCEIVVFVGWIEFFEEKWVGNCDDYLFEQEFGVEVCFEGWLFIVYGDVDCICLEVGKLICGKDMKVYIWVCGGKIWQVWDQLV